MPDQFQLEKVHSLGLGLKVKRLRARAGLSQRALAILTGLNHITIARIELDQFYFHRRDTLEKLAKGLNVDVSKLLSRKLKTHSHGVR